jgi:probable F420-dependent oxidoreductase
VVPVKFGLSMIKFRPEHWEELTIRAERLGFDSVWLSEHLVFTESMFSDIPDTPMKKKPSPFKPLFDVGGQLSYLAAKTSTIRFGTYVYLMGIRHPFVTARTFQTLDYLSGGRADVGVGVGWLREEWVAAGLDPRFRGRMADESLDICRRLWTEKLVEHHGRFWDFDNVAFEPKPVQSPLPIHIGGESDKALARVAKFGDGWLGHEYTLETFRGPYDKLRHLMDDAGRDIKEVQVSIAATANRIEDVCDPSLVQQWEAAGVDQMILFFGKVDNSNNPFEVMEAFAKVHLAA